MYWGVGQLNGNEEPRLNWRAVGRARLWESALAGGWLEAGLRRVATLSRPSRDLGNLVLCQCKVVYSAL